MIQKYFVITVKDKEGFVIPFVSIPSKPPVLYNTLEEAREELDYLRGMYRTRLLKTTQIVKKKGLLDRFRNIPEPSEWPEEKKQQMRWFLANSDIKGVTLTV